MAGGSSAPGSPPSCAQMHLPATSSSSPSPPRRAALGRAVARVLVPIDAVLVPAAGDHVRPPVAVDVVHVIAVRAQVLLRGVVGTKRPGHEARSREPVGAVDDV